MARRSSLHEADDLVVRERLVTPAVSDVLGHYHQGAELVCDLFVCHVPMLRGRRPHRVGSGSVNRRRAGRPVSGSRRIWPGRCPVSVASPSTRS